ncbi:MAG: polysaccharide deacetylase [Alphaproteobacteria bacterium]|nr:polysaccharide deacetylase [Alphaproteobacteria bacterium]
MAEPAMGFAALDAELSAWASEGRTATLWWRDDDASADSAPLVRLLELAGKFSAPLSLAIIPRLCDTSLLRRIEQARDVTPIVHGYAHLNHAPANEKQAEFGAHRDLDVICAELGAGLRVLQDMFGPRLLPVLAPPWNRFAPALAAHLQGLGYIGLSAFRPAPERRPAAGIAQSNCHIDIIDWRARQGPQYANVVLDELTALLRMRRLHPHLPSDPGINGKPVPPGFDPDEPTGILTHHLVQDSDSWKFLSRLLQTVAPHCRAGGGARWLRCTDVFTLDAV